MASAPAFGQPASPGPSADERALAEALFQQGKDALQKGNFAEACPKLAESYRIDAAVGTLLNLAVCHEQDGKLASAWAEFSDAASEGARTGQREREQFARRKAEALRPRVPVLSLHVAAAVQASPRTVIRLNGRTIGRAAWNAPLPVDPGAQRVEVESPGKKPFVGSVDALPGGAPVLDIPALQDDPGAAGVGVARPARPPAEDAQHGQADSQASPGFRTAGVVTGIVGLAALAAGSALGIAALHEKGIRDQSCAQPDNSCPGQGGVNADKNARTDATISTALFAAGGGLVVAGIVVYLAAPRVSRTSGFRVVPSVGVGSVGAMAGGEF